MTPDNLSDRFEKSPSTAKKNQRPDYYEDMNKELFAVLKNWGKINALKEELDNRSIHIAFKHRTEIFLVALKLWKIKNSIPDENVIQQSAEELREEIGSERQYPVEEVIYVLDLYIKAIDEKLSKQY